MDLKQMMRDKKAYTLWIEYEGFEICIRYLDKPDLRRRVERCRQRRFDKRTHQPVEEISDERLLREIAGLIVDWRNLTVGRLAALVPIEIDPDEAEQTVPYSPENAEALVREAYGLDMFLFDAATDLAAFKEAEQENALKNCATSHGNT